MNIVLAKLIKGQIRSHKQATESWAMYLLNNDGLFCFFFPEEWKPKIKVAFMNPRDFDFNSLNPFNKIKIVL